jgi:putative Holliday junction resolvase
MARFMGIDPGMKRVGIAIGDDESGLASPHRTLLRKDDPSLLRELIAEARLLEAGTVIVGLPLRMNGMEGPESKRARGLGKALEERGKLTVVMWDERLTTVAAERQLREVGMRGEKKKSVIDQAAATLLLQSYLDARRAGS